MDFSSIFDIGPYVLVELVKYFISASERLYELASKSDNTLYVKVVVVPIPVIPKDPE